MLSTHQTTLDTRNDLIEFLGGTSLATRQPYDGRTSMGECSNTPQ